LRTAIDPRIVNWLQKSSGMFVVGSHRLRCIAKPSRQVLTKC
jgi:hypothetical protein